MLARHLKEMKERSYRAYVTNTLRLAPQGMYLMTEWTDVIDSIERPQPERSAEEIVDGVIARMGGV